MAHGSKNKLTNTQDQFLVHQEWITTITVKTNEKNVKPALQNMKIINMSGLLNYGKNENGRKSNQLYKYETNKYEWFTELRQK